MPRVTPSWEVPSTMVSPRPGATAPIFKMHNLSSPRPGIPHTQVKWAYTHPVKISWAHTHTWGPKPPQYPKWTWPEQAFTGALHPCYQMPKKYCMELEGMTHAHRHFRFTTIHPAHCRKDATDGERKTQTPTSMYLKDGLHGWF